MEIGVGVSRITGVFSSGVLVGEIVAFGVVVLTVAVSSVAAESSKDMPEGPFVGDDVTSGLAVILTAAGAVSAGVEVISAVAVGTKEGVEVISAVAVGVKEGVDGSLLGINTLHTNFFLSVCLLHLYTTVAVSRVVPALFAVTLYWVLLRALIERF